MGIKKTVFGRAKYKPNTFIGGVAGTINTAELVATKMGLPLSRIKAFSVVGNDIQFAIIGGSYDIVDYFLNNDVSVTYFRDDAGLVTGLGFRAFRACSSLTMIKTDNALFCYDEAFYNTKVTEFIFPNMLRFTGTWGAFTFNPELKKIDCPKLISSSWAAGGMQHCPKLELVNLPKLASIRPNWYGGPDEQYTFVNTKNGFALNVAAGALTSNFGNLDRDVAFAINNRAAIVNYIP
jgi:hypothetical protein